MIMIYFIRRESNFVKIGYSKDVTKRIKELQTASPTPIKVLAVLPGGYKTERELHNLFYKHRKEGEWFKLVREIKYFLRAIRENPKENNIYILYKLGLRLYLKDKAKRLKHKGNPKLYNKIKKYSEV